MAGSIQSQIQELRTSINGLEAQRAVLGDAIVNPALKTLRQQLAMLEEKAALEMTPAEERRMVTILFMDMVGSTSMAEKMDPEEWRRVVSKVHTALGGAITVHRGEVAQYLGDGLLAFFGSREASEDDPENAVRSALDGMGAVASNLTSDKVQLRAGIHSGLVVVGELGHTTHKEFTASGDAVNVAARLQSAAPPGGILISHETYRYVRGVFDLTPRPPLTIKGKSEPLKTYLVRRAKPRPFRSVARGVAGIEAPTIGRDAEMHTLQEAYLRAYDQRYIIWAQMVSDPGVGKSRLLMDMNDWMDLREETYRLLRARAFPDDINQPFALIRRMWFDRFQIAEDTPLEQAEIKWVERFREFSGQEQSEEAAHALGLLVGLPFENSPYIKGMRNDPTQVKGRGLVASRELVRAVRQQNPVVVLLEDLQWADTASWEYLMEVFLGGETDAQLNGLFILGAARPEWRPPAELTALFGPSSPDQTGTKKSGVLIPLAPLTDAAVRELAKALLQRVEEIPENIIRLLVERSEGVPYFTEEMINWFIDHGILDTSSEQWRFLPEKLKEEPLPATLQHLLLTRLSSLSQPERTALQRGAIFGRRFWTGGVEALGVAAGAETLVHLQPRGFVEEQPDSAFQGDTEWNFRQNMLQEVTYESVLKRERAALHKVAADWLEKQAREAGRLDEFAGLLGDHYERAGELSAAADWYFQAGKRAMGQGAPGEARDFYSRALTLLPPVDRERRWRTLLAREEALFVIGDAEPRKADIEALLELARSFEDENFLAEAYLRQARFGTTIGDTTVIEQAAREALATARRCGNEPIEAQILAIIAVWNSSQGNRSAIVENIEKALQLARRLEDETVLAYVLYRAAFCYSEIVDFSKSVPLQIEQIELDHRLGDRLQEATGLGNLGACYISFGLYKQARSVIEQASQICRGLGARRSLAYDLLNLGDIYFTTGDLRKAYQLTEQAMQEISPTQDGRGKSAILEQFGFVLMAMGDIPSAARRFNEAQELALSLGITGRAKEIKVGLVACAAMQGQMDEASKLVHEVWDYVKEHGWVGLSGPPRFMLICAETFDTLGEDENVQEVLNMGYQGLMGVAETINVPEWRKSFLENVPTHRAFLEMWERRKK